MNNPNIENRSSVNCQEVTIGISVPFTLETTFSNYCAGNWCAPVVLQCPHCGIVGNRTFEDGTSLTDEIDSIPTLSIKSEDLVGANGVNIHTIEISSSSSIINGQEISIELGEYSIDRNGYYNLNFEINQ